MQVEQLNKKFELVNESFTPSEVTDLIVKSIDSQINNYKLKKFSNWIHDHKCDQGLYDHEISQLQNRKQELLGMIQEAQMIGCKIKLTEKLELALDNAINN